jgi:predicted enzyme related to lactoylglutathione lyase
MTDRPKALSITPLFVVSNLQRSLDFYTKLGFGEPGVWGEPPCFAMMNRDNLELMLSLGEGDAGPRPNGNGVWDMYIRVTDVEAETAALKDAGVTIARGPTTMTEYQMREVEVVDPDGFRVCLAQNVS